VTSSPARSLPIRVLIVEDEQKLASLVANALQSEGYSVSVVRDGNSVVSRLTTEGADVVVLDIMLPGRDGLSILKEMRAGGIMTPVLVLSARGEVGERIEGLNSGADDYLSKPFVLAEMLARVRALARRRTERSTGPLQLADLVLDPLSRSVRRGGKLVEMSAREYKLLEFLMRAEGQICARAAIIKHVWEYNFDPGTNLVDVYIMRVREKIDADFHPKLLHSIRGIGYVLRVAP
jgi:DNA-binding response OmpR family regulator